MVFEAWLRQRLQRNRMKTATSAEREYFTAQVMARVRELPQPQSSPVGAALLSGLASYLTLPRLSFAAAVAAVLVAATAAHRTDTARLAADLSRHAVILAALSDNGPLLENDIEALADEVDAGDRLMMLAESASSSDDASWIEQMSQLIDQLDENAFTGTSDSSDSNWQEELEMMDEEELSTAS